MEKLTLKEIAGETLTKQEELLNNSEKFNLTRLSISADTYIPSGFNSFVVKIKQ